MLNQLLKFTLVSSILIWLKPRWKGLLALSGLVILVHVMHGEYLGYVELSGDRSFLVWSYVLKWVVLVLGVVTYIIMALSGPKSRRSNRAMPGQGGSATGAGGTAPGGADDGFDFLRHKKRLENRAEKVISEKGR